MKTIAAATAFLMLTATAWADGPQNAQTDDPANTNEPIVLSEAEMDHITAGGVGDGYWISLTPLSRGEHTSTSTASGYVRTVSVIHYDFRND